MATQTLLCTRGQHTWRRESQRGRPPRVCPDSECAGKVITEPVNDESVSNNGTVIGGAALCDRLMADLASRGMLLSQQKSHVYAGPRY